MPATKEKRYLKMPDLRKRWGNCSHMTIESRLASDPDFPRPMRLTPGSPRLWDEDEIAAYERSKVVAKARA